VAATGQNPEVLRTPVADAQFAALAPPFEAPPIPDSFYRRRGKRVIDFALGLALFVLLLPLIGAVALAVLLTSGWPIFYGSQRVGLDGRKFQMWKFRTMVPDADAVFERWKDTHPERASRLLTHWKLEGDPRVTALGRFLRKSSLDELPQFWNVLCGEMSIAGPRPYLSRESLDPALAAAIVAVRPGLTGPFQVCGRKELSPRSRMELEAAYAPEMGLMKDIGYMLQTIKPLMRLDGH
jgi:lipopolysaccharide/colanic/teichoic acid biosynthesis glycosyltransferase